MRNGEIRNVERPVVSRIGDSVRHAARHSATASRFTSKAQDVLEDGLYQATRALKMLKRRAKAVEDTTRHYVKREPLKAVAAIAGIALLAGFFIGLSKRRRPRRIFGAAV